MKDANRVGVYVLIALAGLLLAIGCCNLVVLSFIAGNLTAGGRVVSVQASPIPPPFPSTPPVSFRSGSNLAANGDFEEDDFGRVANWSQTNIETLRWYLVQDTPRGRENARWVEWVNLAEDGRGHGLESVDHQSCDYYCSSEAIQLVPIKEGKTYVLSAEARIEEGNDAVLYMDFLDANKARIKPYTGAGYSRQWSQQSITAQAPAGSRYIRIILYTNNKPQGIVYWDNVELKVKE